MYLFVVCLDKTNKEGDSLLCCLFNDRLRRRRGPPRGGAFQVSPQVSVSFLSLFCLFSVSFLFIVSLSFSYLLLCLLICACSCLSGLCLFFSLYGLGFVLRLLSPLLLYRASLLLCFCLFVCLLLPLLLFVWVYVEVYLITAVVVSLSPTVSSTKP